MSRELDGNIVFERTYEGDVADLWELWTTPAGIEAWWGPERFSVKVHELDLRAGGVMRYAMTAVGADEVQFMKQAGMPVTTETSMIYTEIVPGKSISFTNRVDFIPGVAPYDTGNKVEFIQEGGNVRMVLTLDRMHSDEWTMRVQMGWESQLRKMDQVMAGKGAR